MASSEFDFGGVHQKSTIIPSESPLGGIDVEAEEELFHNTIRAILVSCLFFLGFYAIAHHLISHFKREPESEDYYLLDCETTVSSVYLHNHNNNSNDQQLQSQLGNSSLFLLVYMIPYYLCTFSLACSIAAVCLLPFSILSNEVLTRYPNNYYLQWLNRSVMSALWNSLFFFCNLNLFLLLPFAYFFTESQGASSSSNGPHSHAASIAAKVYETFVSLFWLTVLVAGLVLIFCAITNFDYFNIAIYPDNGTSATVTGSNGKGSPNAGASGGGGADAGWWFRSSIGLVVGTTKAQQMQFEKERQKNTILLVWDVSWNFIPLLYSCMSLIGACMHLLCTPLGFAKLFTVLGKVLTKPQFMHDIQQDRDSLELQRDLIKRKLEILKEKQELEQNNNNIDNLTDITNTSTKLSSGKILTKTKRQFLSRSFTGFDKQSPKQHRWSTELENDETSMQIRHSRLSLSRSLTHGDILANGDTSNSVYARNGSRVTSSQSELAQLQSDLVKVTSEVDSLNKKLSIAFWRRNLGYPLMLLLLLIMTCLCVFLVGINTVALLFGQTSLPFVDKERENAIDNAINSLSYAASSSSHSSVSGSSSANSGGVASMLHKSAVGLLGWLAVVIEISLTFYFMLASLIGFYNLPFLKALLPVYKDTALHILIINCVFILIVGSALPLVMRTLGLSNLDLIGSFGRLKWLNNLYLVLFYNLLFASFTVWCLTRTFTAAVREELYMRYLLLKCQLMAFYQKYTTSTTPTSAHHSSLQHSSRTNTDGNHLASCSLHTWHLLKSAFYSVTTRKRSGGN